MSILLQERVPAQQSLKWQIHQYHYQTRGLELWTNKDIPFNGTSNYIAAQQKAMMIIRKLRYSKNLPGSLCILETGAGNAVFAVNFIRAFQLICQKNELPYFEKLSYLLTDFSKNTLMQISQQPFIQEWLARGVIQLGCVNFTNPEEFSSLDGEPKSLKKYSVVALICNYQFCVLPTAVLKIKNRQLFQKFIELYYRGDQPEPPLLKDLKQEHLYEVSSYEPIDIDSYFDEPNEWQVFKTLLSKCPVATFNYQAELLKSLMNWFEYLTPEGIILASDKAYPSFDMLEGQSDYHPSTHGETLASIVNFPLLELFFKQAKYQVCRTSNPHFILQTILISKHDLSEKVTDFFEHVFCNLNNNNRAQIMLQQASLAFKKRDYTLAITLYNRLLPILPDDPVLLSSLGMTYLAIGDLDKALEYYLRPKNDYLNIYSSYAVLGEIYAQQGQYEKAIANYKRSLCFLGDKALIYYNIGICRAKLQEWDLAELAFFRASQLAPSDIDVSRALAAARQEKKKANP